MHKAWTCSNSNPGWLAARAGQARSEGVSRNRRRVILSFTMPSNLPAHFLDLVADAALKSFWRRRSLHSFLRRSGIAATFLATWREDETKRDFLHRAFVALEKSERGAAIVAGMATTLADQTTFPDLDGWEDSAAKRDAAAKAVASLKAYVTKDREDKAEERAQAASRRRAAEMRAEFAKRRADLDTLSAKLDSLAGKIGTPEAGYAFQNWFYELADYFEVLCRRPYNNNGRQIDGTITVDGTTYLVELKFTGNATGVGDVDSLHKKVHDKADNTMGLLVSMAGYTSTALDGASGPRMLLLLMDHSHLYYMLAGSVTLGELVMRLRRNASQTGHGFIPIADL